MSRAKRNRRPVARAAAHSPIGLTWSGKTKAQYSAAAAAEQASPKAKKYFAARMHRNGRTVPLAVWDGVEDYVCAPPPALLAERLAHARNFARGEPLRFGGKVGIVQLHYHESYRTFVREKLSWFENCFDVVIVWVRDRRTYASFVAEFQVLSLDGGAP